MMITRSMGKKRIAEEAELQLPENNKRQKQITAPLSALFTVVEENLKTETSPPTENLTPERVTIISTQSEDAVSISSIDKANRFLSKLYDELLPQPPREPRSERTVQYDFIRKTLIVTFYNESIEESTLEKPTDFFGKITYPNGAFYIGNLKDGKREGYGTLHFPAKNAQYFGHFLNDRFHGKGRLITPEREYKGNFYEGKFHGEGFLKMGEHKWYDGEFQRGLYHGKGHYVTDKISYLGSFSNNKFDGYGIVTNLSDWTVVRGTFCMGKLISKKDPSF